MLCYEIRQGGCSYFQVLKAHKNVVMYAYMTQNTTLGCLIHQPDLTTERICCNPLFHLCSFSGYNQMLIQINNISTFHSTSIKISNSYSWLSPIPNMERVLIKEGVWHTNMQWGGVLIKCRSEIYSKIHFHLNFAKYAGPINRTVLKKFPKKKRKKMDVRQGNRDL